MDFLQVTGETVDTLLSGDQWLIEGMLAAYCKRCRIDPMEVAAVETELPDGSTAYWYGVLELDKDGEPKGVRPPTWWRKLLETIYRHHLSILWFLCVCGALPVLLLFGRRWHSPTYNAISVR